MTRSENEKVGRGTLDGFLVFFYCHIIKPSGRSNHLPILQDPGRRGGGGGGGGGKTPDLLLLRLMTK